jgi:hypothetical protein
MPVKQQVEYLRSRADRLREIACFESAISPELRQLAGELDERADALEETADLAPVRRRN